MCVLEEAFTRERIYMSFPYHQDPQNPHTRVEKFNIKWLSGLGIWVVDSELDHDPPAPTVTTAYRILNSTNGLMLFEYGLYSFYHIIWNPTLRQHVVLPESNIFPPVVSFIGYDPIDQKYKVLSMSGHSDYGTHAAEYLKVFTLGAKEKWGKIEIHPRLYEHIRATRGNMDSRQISVRGGICINGVLYYYLVERDFIVSLIDVRAETFAKIIKPEGVCDVDIRDVTCAMINYKGKLAWSCTRTSSLWVLEDAQKQEWSLRPLDGQIKNSSRHYFCGVTQGHEAIFMPKKKKQPF
ncbi:unnamed protein product [Arabis nemorensis]|uniref:F-box associated beta-propeller type 3 domain-containing protein n=1 Tax=Arabis nemorensis TaxID=586526 RepID=A0A565ALU9_9BRAS|nr:unnamed protein product [Arabis nemorensis]